MSPGVRTCSCRPIAVNVTTVIATTSVIPTRRVGAKNQIWLNAMNSRTDPATLAPATTGTTTNRTTRYAALSRVLPVIAARWPSSW